MIRAAIVDQTPPATPPNPGAVASVSTPGDTDPANDTAIDQTIVQ